MKDLFPAIGIPGSEVSGERFYSWDSFRVSLWLMHVGPHTSQG